MHRPSPSARFSGISAVRFRMAVRGITPTLRKPSPPKRALTHATLTTNLTATARATSKATTWVLSTVGIDKVIAALSGSRKLLPEIATKVSWSDYQMAMAFAFTVCAALVNLQVTSNKKEVNAGLDLVGGSVKRLAAEIESGKSNTNDQFSNAKAANSLIFEKLSAQIDNNQKATNMQLKTLSAESEVAARAIKKMGTTLVAVAEQQKETRESLTSIHVQLTKINEAN